MNDIKCIFCGNSKNVVDYDNHYYDCESCDKHFYARFVPNKLRRDEEVEE